ncbi:hypothetical protein BJP05_02990 [Corynebacterium sp. NML98-0116]|nr:hypothetical protein BJP05_02990 [Corynebacterium sp. NML98-0116]
MISVSEHQFFCEFQCRLVLSKLEQIPQFGFQLKKIEFRLVTNDSRNPRKVPSADYLVILEENTPIIA